MSEIIVSVTWDELGKFPDDERWGFKGCLYAYIAPDNEEILYIGKSWGRSVRQRWERDAKKDFWNDLERIRGIWVHSTSIGFVDVLQGKDLDDKFLECVEGLLIFEEQSWGNITYKGSRTPLPGLRVICEGLWTGRGKVYGDL